MLLESLFQHKTKVISLLDPHTHTYQLAQQADHVNDAEGELGTNVVWMFPKLWSPDAPAKKH